MATQPALTQLIRLLGRGDMPGVLGLHSEPDPAELTESQRQRLAEWIDLRLEAVAVELVQEAATSDDVTSADAGRHFVADRIRAFDDLLTSAQVARLLEATDEVIDGWA